MLDCGTSVEHPGPAAEKPGPALTEAHVEALIEARAKVLVREELESYVTQHSKGAGEEIPLEIQQAVHTDMLHLMDIQDRMPGVDGRKSSWSLPDPLEPSAPHRQALDGTRVFNPKWWREASADVNREYISTIVKVVQQNTATKHKLPPALAQKTGLIRSAALVYFKTLKRTYIADHEEDAARKRQRKMLEDKMHMRCHRRADNLRLGFDALRKLFGKARTVGLEQAVCTPCQSDEASTDGEATHDEREELRAKARVGQRALEVRTPAWRSRKLTILYVILAVLSRFVRERASLTEPKPKLPVRKRRGHGQGGDEEELVPSSDDSDTEEMRAQYLAKIRDAVKDWSTINVHANQRHERFRGPPANSRQELRVSRKNPIYKEYISSKWASTSTERSQLYDKALSCPSTFTIFDLDFPEGLIPEDDLGWLGDEEDEDGESESLISGAASGSGGGGAL
ncbi:hypothetical protein TRAPUB_10802 [Trametes pubescens]|uniref:Uncharacterized protein n=1 Tax=Trametes pubescens TaxID=154538 RepID=A0A1M2VYQ5_TRAPU|nr:hypothetical protein TRAPUB_10802 [Trametes pubescens]